MKSDPGRTALRLGSYGALAFLPVALVAWVYSYWLLTPYPTTTLFTVGVGTLSVLLAAMAFIYGQFQTQVEDTHSSAADLANERLTDPSELENRKSLLLAELWFPSVGTTILVVMLSVLFLTVFLACFALVDPAVWLERTASASYDVFGAYVAAFLLLFVSSLAGRVSNATAYVRGIKPPEPGRDHPPSQPPAQH